MSSFQIIYALALLALTYPGWQAGHCRVVLVLWANMLAILAIAGAWDLGLIGDLERFRYFLVIDLASGAALVIKPGLSRVVAIGYAVGFPFYIPLISDLFTEETKALTVICTQSALQIGALAFGSLGGNSGSGGRRNRRLLASRSSLASASGGVSLPGGAISSNSARIGALE